MLENLLAELQEQIEVCGFEKDVEVLVQLDDHENTTGYKRNILLKRAAGDYVCFFDDDDEPSQDYIKLIMDALEDKPDVVGMRGLLYQDGAYQGVFEHSIQHKGWSNGAGTFKRRPNHLNPVRRDLALKVGFPDVTFAEDQDYSMRLLPLLNKEQMVVKPIYHYQARSK